MTILTKAEVKDRLVGAAETLRRLPREKLREFSSSWPDVVPDPGLAYGYGETIVRTNPPSPRDITLMLEAARWIYALEPGYERQLMWLRAFEVPWKTVSYKLAWSEKKVRNDHDTFLAMITLLIRMKDEADQKPKPVRLASGAISSASTRTIFKPCQKQASPPKANGLTSIRP